MRLFSLALAAFLLAVPVAAHADTIVAFQLDAFFNSGASATGNIGLDTTNGIVQSGEVTVSGAGSYSGTFTFSKQAVDYNEAILIFADAVFVLALPPATLVGYTGGVICSKGMTCNTYPTNISDYLYIADTGTLTPIIAVPPVAQTPEPSGLVLLGTGVVGMFGVARRKFARA